MSELSLALNLEISSRIRHKAFVMNGRGDLLVDGAAVITNDLNGKRTLVILADGVEADVEEFGLGKARRLYKQPGTITKAIKASEHLAKTLDADTIKKDKNL